MPKNDKELMVLETGTVIIGLPPILQENSTEEELSLQKEYRRALSLPITKQIVYYADYTDEKSVQEVVTVEVNKRFEYMEEGKKQIWYSVGITLKDGKTIEIHNGYLKQMQAPKFVEEMRKMEEAMAEE